MSPVVKEKNHVRLVFLGAAGVGKTALIHRFLMDTFEPKHRRTVEELHSKEYEVSGATLKVEILDTSGSYSFPAMRKLSIQNSDAFALVYAVDDAESFESVKSLREEILEVKEDKFPPIVVVGNKAESGSERQVPAEDALSLVELDWNSRFMETSAKDNENVLEVFKELLQQANLPSRLSPALCKRRETLPKEQVLRPPMNKTNSCSVVLSHRPPAAGGKAPAAAAPAGNSGGLGGEKPKPTTLPPTPSFLFPTQPAGTGESWR